MAARLRLKVGVDGSEAPLRSPSATVLPAGRRDVAQLGSAPRSGRGGRRFKSCHPDARELGYNVALVFANFRRSVILAAPLWTDLAPSIVLAIAALLLPEVGRTVGTASVALTVLAIVLAVRRLAGGTSRALTAVLIGLLPAIVLLGVLHDLPGLTVPLSVSRLILLVLWSVTSVTLGLEVTRHVIGRRALADVWISILAAGAVTAYFAGALVRLLLPGRGPSARLAWILLEEDNAHVVGVIREVLLDGPRGAQLAEIYGTAFANIPLLLMNLFGGPLAGESDVRLQAVTGFTVSTIVAIVLIGSALALLSALPRHVHRTEASAERPPISVPEILLGGVYTAVSVLAAASLLVVLPMRTGFLTLVWGLTLVLVSSALIAITPAAASKATRVVLVVSIVGTAALLLSSWPFIIMALLPALALPREWISWKRLASLIRQHRVRAATALALSLAALAVGCTWFLRWGLAAEVLSYGRGILLLQASSIVADANITRLSAIILVVAVAMIIRSTVAPSRTPLLLALVGPPLGAGLLYLGLRVAATVLTDGELNYSGVKLLYAIIVLSVALGLTALAAHAHEGGRIGVLVTGVILALVHWTSPTVGLHTDWWERTDLDGLPHATAVVDAIRNSSPDLPIRCLPSFGTSVTPVTRWAAYFCPRWMEDAFNEGRFHGARDAFLNAEGTTFDDIIARTLADNPSEYLFAYRMQMGIGWFGWDGRS